MTSQIFLVMHFKFGWLVCAFYPCVMIYYTVSKSYYLSLYLFMDLLEIPLLSGTTGLVFTTEGFVLYPWLIVENLLFSTEELWRRAVVNDV